MFPYLAGAEVRHCQQLGKEPSPKGKSLLQSTTLAAPDMSHELLQQTTSKILKQKAIGGFARLSIRQ